MTTIRTLRPTDLVLLASLNGEEFRNEAQTRERLGREGGRPVPLARLVAQWLGLSSGQATWLAHEGGSLAGVLVTRSSVGRIAWEVEALLVPDDHRAEEVCAELLAGLEPAAAKTGVQKVFLRLYRNSSVEPVARQAGFAPYLAETLYYREHPGDVARPSLALRTKLGRDMFQLYLLYNQVVPAPVRRAEAVNYQEWRHTPERGLRRPGRREFVYEHGGQIVGWLGVTTEGSIGLLDVMIHPAESDKLAALLDYGLSRLGGHSPVYCTAAEFDVALPRLLEERGFGLVASYSTYVKRVALPVAERSWMPARA